MTKVKDRIKKLQHIVGAYPDGIIGNETLTKFRLKLNISKAMTAHFFGNVHHETGGYKIAEESMTYTSAKRIMQVWPSRFKAESEAIPFVRNPIGLANKVYGGRMGNNQPNDGWKYIGRGAIQTTGKYSYDRLGKFVNDDLVSYPEHVAPHYYWESAIFYFNDRRLWGLVDDISEKSIKLIRYRINGGYNGLADTRKWVKHYYNLMKD